VCCCGVFDVVDVVDFVPFHIIILKTEAVVVGGFCCCWLIAAADPHCRTEQNCSCCSSCFFRAFSFEFFTN